LILLLSLGFGLGVLATVLADEIEHKRHRVIGTRRNADVRAAVYGVIDSLAQDSTLARFKVK
jgi:hypothetical protein